MFTDDDLLPLAGIQHIAFCERQFALIHIEQVWDENRLTVLGEQFHDRVHDGETEMRGDVRITRGVPLRSGRLGLSGKADAVEFHRVRPPQTGVNIPGAHGLWRPFPVEYKVGAPRPERNAEVQLCAQAMCIEEMLGGEVPTGALFYGRSRRRADVTFTPVLREETERLAAHMHEIFQAKLTPRATYERKCRSCSLVALCMPKTTGAPRPVETYLTGQISASVSQDDGRAE